MLIPLKSLLRKLAGIAIYQAGIGYAFESITRPEGAIVLMYHSVANAANAAFIDPPNRISQEKFEIQMRFLRRHRRVVPVSTLVQELAKGNTFPAGTVCITFDDGYLDNLTIAAPILEKYELPAMLYLATGYVERGASQWADVLYWLLRHRTSDRLSIPWISPERSNLASRGDMAGTRELLHRFLLEACYEDRARTLEALEQQLAPSCRPPRLTLTWDDVRELRRRYPLFEIGGHTREHIDLRRHKGDPARMQINRCADDLRRELGAEPEHFSFPYGRWCPETRGLVIAAGWKSAVGISAKIRVDRESDRFAIPRVEAPQTLADLGFKTSGAYPGVFSWLGKT